MPEKTPTVLAVATRRAERVRAGEKVAIKKQPSGSLKVTACKKHGQIKELAGSLKSDARLTDAELKEAIADARVARGMRG